MASAWGSSWGTAWGTSWLAGAPPPEVVIPETPFDPLVHLPVNLFPTTGRIAALMGFYAAEGRAPTPAEAEALVGPAVEYGDRADPLPDGFAGRDWGNPNWLRRLVSEAG